MTLTRAANTEFKRLTTGPLYSERELRKAEQNLFDDGFIRTEDNSKLGIRIFNDMEGTTAIIHLDELKCHPNNSGTMMIGDKVTTIWNYNKEKQPPLSTRIRQFFFPAPR